MAFPSSIPEVPDWQYDGLLPAVTAVGVELEGRSPYAVDVLGLVKRFGHTDRRRALLRKFFAFRGELRDCGWHSGFQWLNGSFLEDVERVGHGREPGDIDVVSFLYYSEVFDFEKARHLASSDGHEDVKARFWIDSYVVNLNGPVDVVLCWAMYWQSLWGHRKLDRMEKGFVRVSIGDDDGSALALLDHLDEEAG